MELAELRKEPHLSASGISDYIECSLLYKFGRIDKLPPTFKSDSLVLGTALHKTIANFHEARKQGEILPEEKLKSKLVQYLEEAAQNENQIHYKEGNFSTLLQQAQALLAAFHTGFEIDSRTEVLSVETPFKFHIDSVPVPIIGAMDLLESDGGILIISDLKTSAKAYSKDQIDQNFQMTLYQMAAREMNFGDSEILLRLDVLVKSKKECRFQQHYTTRTELDERRTMKKIQAVWQGISRGVFIPNDTSWKCKQCAYKIYCEEWFQQKEEII